MPTTRQKAADTGSEVLHGLVEEKRVRKPRSAGSSSAPKTRLKKGAKKGKGRLDPNLPHIAVANLLYERGNNTQFPEKSPQLNPNQQKPRTWSTDKAPITDPSQLPEGWSVNELDLDPSDTDAQIARCQKRIAEGIMPQIFEDRLKKFSKIKEEKMAMVKSEPDGLSWEVVQRLDCLKKIQDSLEQEDPGNNLPNVRGIIAAYRTQQLTWNENFVTYWSNGNLLAGPRQLDMKELYGLSAKHGPKGFWVEGVSSTSHGSDIHAEILQIDGYKPAPMNAFFPAAISHRALAIHSTKADVDQIRIAIRNPATAHSNTMAMTVEHDFLLDTGSSSMRLFPQDIAEIETLSGAVVPGIGNSMNQTAAGLMNVQNVVLQAMIYVQGEALLPGWVNIKACVSSSGGAGAERLSGVWLFNLLFILSMPDNQRGLFIGTDVGEMLATLPIPDYRNAIPAPIIY
ncbi:hypothetical protein N7457_006959 [Penicillium paradoxum]|uniref:uncharacterized protein n=1 Tax=Penicillium paradoxum TaxID=176176 RepID=UPI002548602C|nr:uncharacterized protein N7457_006959 [Penicillium paradoxum]KAJ5779239.1 hypothetical protein N7457_006959 [Penicillium paradoxum]